MTDRSSNILLYHPNIPYEQKIWIAGLLNLISYVPPEDGCPFLELPNEMICVICSHLDQEWNLKMTCKRMADVIGLYQASINGLTLSTGQSRHYGIKPITINGGKHIMLDTNQARSYSQIIKLKKCYTGIKTLMIKNRIDKIHLEEMVSWNNLQILILEDGHTEVKCECDAETIIFNRDKSTIITMLCNMKCVNLKKIMINTIINHGLPDVDDMQMLSWAYQDIIRIVTKCINLETCTFYISVIDENMANEFIDKIDKKIGDKNVSYVIKTNENPQYYTGTVEIEGRIE